ncbi:MAG: cohesin domain-containing protein, partial [Candidatus Saccharibacteria bacterium]
MKISKNISKSKLIAVVVVLVFAVLGAAMLVFSKAATPVTTTSTLIQQSAAATTGLLLNPSSGSFVVGTNFNVSIKVDSGAEPIYTVGAILNYDATKLDFVSANNTGSPFTGIAQLSSPAGSGKVNINLFIPSVPGQAGPGSTTGSQIVANLTFKAKAGVSSSTAMTFTGPATAENGVFSSTNNQNIWDGNPSGGTFTLTSSGGSGSGGTTTPPAGGGGSGSGGTTTPPAGGGGS